MRRFLFAVLAALTAVLTIPAAALAAPSSGAASVPKVAGGGLDARAAAGVRDGAVTAATWYTGTVAAGATQSWTWNNANPLSSVYKVGFAPTGAGTTTQCSFGVDRSWYSQLSSGERKFHFVLRNRGTLACGATVLLAQAAAASVGNSGFLSPGSTNYQMFKVHDLAGSPSSQLLGLSPIGAVGGTPCQLEVTASWTVQGTGITGRELHYFVKNVGAQACSADVLRASPTVTGSSFNVGDLASGGTAHAVWYNANPLNAVYVPRFAPGTLVAGQNCTLEITRESYVQVLTASGAPMRQLHLSVRNNGSHTCLNLQVYLPTIAA